MSSDPEDECSRSGNHRGRSAGERPRPVAFSGSGPIESQEKNQLSASPSTPLSVHSTPSFDGETAHLFQRIYGPDQERWDFTLCFTRLRKGEGRAWS